MVVMSRFSWTGQSVVLQVLTNITLNGIENEYLSHKTVCNKCIPWESIWLNNGNILIVVHWYMKTGNY